MPMERPRLDRTLLVECGADINALTNEGETPLDFVNETKFIGYQLLARYLKSKGARSGNAEKASRKRT